MEKKTLLILIILFAGLALLFMAFSGGKTAAPEQSQVTQPIQQTEVIPVPPADESIAAALPEVPEELTILENDRYTAIFSNWGASLKTLSLRQFHKDDKKDEKLELLYQVEDGKNSYIIDDVYQKEPYSKTAWTVTNKSADSITYRYVDSEGLQVDKTFKFIQGAYGLEITLDFKNLSPNVLMRQFIVRGPAGICPEFDPRYGVTGYSGNFEAGKWDVREEAGKDIISRIAEGKNKEYDVNFTKWLGITNKYFAATFVPVEQQCFGFLKYDFIIDKNVPEIAGKINSKYGGKPSYQQVRQEFLTTYQSSIKPNLEILLHSQRLYFEVGDKVTTLHLYSYAGPKKNDELMAEPFGKNIHGQMLSYGWFGFISKILLAVLNAFFWFFGNYGIAIVMLTLLVKVCMFPLTKKQYVAQYRMQDLSPKMKALKEKYKNDRTKMQAETFKLFKEHGVNPMSGCLPLLLQLPIFIGLYQALYVSIDLRIAPFAFWITDLSQPDMFAQLSFSILGTDKVRLLPIIMTVSWFIQSLLQPKSPDPEQAMQQKIFLIMPIAFGFLFYSMPSGLVLYWLANTLFSIAEQQVIKKVFLPKAHAVKA